jgi:hypothetical protein
VYRSNIDSDDMGNYLGLLRRQLIGGGWNSSDNIPGTRSGHSAAFPTNVFGGTAAARGCSGKNLKIKWRGIISLSNI